MEIRINKDWKVATDGELNVILTHRRTRAKRGTGEEYDTIEVAGYFSTPQNALKEIVRRELHGPGLDTLIQVCTRIDEVYRDIDKALERPSDFLRELYGAETLESAECIANKKESMCKRITHSQILFNQHNT